MLASFILTAFTPRQHTALAAFGLLTIILAGVATCLVILWGLLQLAFLALQAIVTTLASIGATFNAANPTIRLIVLVIVLYAVYRAYRRTSRR